MKTLLSVRLAAVVLCATSAFGQWLDYPTAGVPRTKDGKADLAAPAEAKPSEHDVVALMLPSIKNSAEHSRN